MKNPRNTSARAVAGFTLAAALFTVPLLHADEGPTEAKGPVVLPAEVVALPVEQAILTAPPHVPPPIKRTYSARVVARIAFGI